MHAHSHAWLLNAHSVVPVRLRGNLEVGQRGQPSAVTAQRQGLFARRLLGHKGMQTGLTGSESDLVTSYLSAAGLPGQWGTGQLQVRPGGSHLEIPPHHQSVCCPTADDLNLRPLHGQFWAGYACISALPCTRQLQGVWHSAWPCA